MPSDYEQLKARVEKLESLLADLQSPNLITPQFQQVLDRYGLASDVKSAGSENQTVNEAGSGTYAVLSAPDKWAKATLAGSDYYFPAWN